MFLCALVGSSGHCVGLQSYFEQTMLCNLSLLYCFLAVNPLQFCTEFYYAYIHRYVDRHFSALHAVWAYLIFGFQMTKQQKQQQQHIFIFSMHVFHLLYQYEAEPTYNDNTELSTSFLSVMNILTHYSQHKGQIFFTSTPPVFVLGWL